MKFKSPIFLVVALTGMVFLLSACQEQKSETYYFSHPEALKRVVLECQKTETLDAQCVQAYHTMAHLRNLSQAFIQSQTDFGQRILRAQIRAADLSEQLAIAKKDHAPTEKLEKQLAAAEQNINNLRAVVGLFIRI